MNHKDISIVVPSYNRSSELLELLDSVLNQDIAPGEIVVIEDCSPQRDRIRVICTQYFEKFKSIGVSLNYVENDVNLGFDRNVRKCLNLASGKWALLLGNDDVLLSNAVETLVDFLNKNNALVVSRSFLRFDTDINHPLGVSKICDHDTVFRQGESSSKFIFRSGAFIGGLAFNVEFCRLNEADQYDGSLYYQIYLFALAFCQGGIGYISTPIAAGRSGNPPMFGAADSEKTLHVPGGYTAAGRAHMWESVMRIVGDVQKKFRQELLSDIRQELCVRQSFHIFEANVGAGHRANIDLARALNRLDLFLHPIPVTFFCLNMVLGSRAEVFYRVARRCFQRT